MALYRITLIIIVPFLAFGCAVVAVPIPVPENKVISGSEVEKEALSFVIIGSTTKDDVVNALGPPSIHIMGENIFVYDWVKRNLLILWAAGVGGSGDAGIKELGKHYVLFFRFDGNDHVIDYEITSRSKFESYSDHLLDWIKESKK